MGLEFCMWVLFISHIWAADRSEVWVGVRRYITIRIYFIGVHESRLGGPANIKIEHHLITQEI